MPDFLRDALRGGALAVARVAEDNSVVDTVPHARLDAIGRMKRADQRGRELERFVADMFRQYHFKVTLNAGVARPRQTDILAARVNEVYLVECKWRNDKANIDDLDSLRSRLRRTNDGVVGVLVSVPGFSGTVLHDVEHRREQPIVLISGDELRLVGGSRGSLPDLLWRKKDALLTDGKVLLDEPPSKRGTRRRLFALPPAERQFVLPDRSPEQVIECEGAFGQFVFAHELPDIDWVPADGLGVTLDVAPQVLDQRGLLELVDRLADLGWATADARWSIQQSRRNWHGFGSAAFATELPRWQHRANSPDAHHSEEICYLDRCDGGFYTITANLAARQFRRTTMVSLSFQLQGTPLDTAPLLQLCRSVGVHDALYFRPRTEKSVSRHRPDDQHSRAVQPLGYVTTPERDPAFPFTEWATGIIIANPYRRSAGGGGIGPAPEDLRMLQDSEYLICDLAEHHPLDGRTCEYHVRAFEIARTSDALVCRPVTNWTSVDANREENGNAEHEW